jgi:hypothetical protein
MRRQVRGLGVPGRGRREGDAACRRLDVSSQSLQLLRQRRQRASFALLHRAPERWSEQSGDQLGVRRRPAPNTAPSVFRDRGRAVRLPAPLGAPE